MYNYETERPKIFTEEGIEKLLQVHAAVINRPNPTISAGAVISKVCGCSWEVLACLDFLKEKRAIFENYTDPDSTPGQARIFTS